VSSALGAAREPRPLLILSSEARDAGPERVGMIAEAGRRGFEVVAIAREERLAAVDTAASECRADTIAVCGDGWLQATVAAVAAGRDLPFGCIPSAPGDLLAQDIGADGADPRLALAGLLDAPERRIDLAEVNGVAFVNYVALGLEIAPAASDEAHADLHHGRGTRRARVRRARPSGLRAVGHVEDRAGAPALLVSNNRFALHRLGIGARPRIDAGVLGVAILSIRPEDRRRGSARRAWRERASTRLELAAEGAIHAEVDGLARVFNPPLRFRILPHALRALTSARV